MSSQAVEKKGLLKRKRKDPEGRMPLKDHFKELRNRVFVCAVALILFSVVGWFLYPQVLEAIQQPLKDASAQDGREASLNFAGVITAFDLQIQMSIFIGIVLSSPVWIYQGWAFLAPGFTKKEKFYSLGYLFTAIPLFLLGIAVAWFALPNLVRVMTNFIPDGSTNLIPARDYIGFVTRLMLTFGISFILPVLLVGMNMLGVLPSKVLIKSWRIVLFLVCLFAAVAAPGTDAMSMFFLAAPLLALFALAILITHFLDKRKAKKEAKRAKESDETVASTRELDEIN
ncbi:MAG: twin-arginine translocase subunit TatC [Micrococcaceae bacterium]